MFNPFACYRKLIPVLLFVCVLSTAVAQTVPSYLPFKDDSLAGLAINKLMEQRCKKDVSALKGKNRKYIADLYEERLNYIKEMTARKELITATDAQDYLQAVTDNIIKANAVLAGLQTHFHFSKSSVPNACSMGEGTILFNIGLFTRLENESQFAFVLCHELAHLYLNHGNNSIDKYVTTLYSEETQSELRKIKNATYQKREQVEQLVKQFTFRSRRHSRDHESEADSLGLVFLKNAGYPASAALSLLGILDKVDEETFNAGTFLSERFGSKDYPFQPRWLAKEEGLLGGHAELTKDEKMEDSLKTHPDCTARIKMLTPAVTQHTGSGSRDFIAGEETFKTLQQRFSCEMIEYSLNSKQLSQGLYLAIQLLHSKKNERYGVAITGRILNSIYAAQKIHRLGGCVDLPSPGYPGSYNLVLQFIQNLNLDDIGEINYHFLKPYEQQLLTDEDYVYALALSKQYNNKPAENSQWINYYNKSFHPKKYKFN